MGDGAGAIAAELGRVSRPTPAYTATAETILELAKTAHFRYLEQPFEERRRLLETLLSNCAFDRGSLCPTYSKPFDVQETAQAANSVEKMICHQLAALHTLGMEEVIRFQGLPTTYPPAERARVLHSIVRLFECSQTAALTVQKLKSNGTQRVEVKYQQVNVADGGQFVVALHFTRTMACCVGSMRGVLRVATLIISASSATVTRS